MAASLDQLGVPPEYRERVKIMWIGSIFLGIWMWVICAFVWKLDGQDQNQWFQYQLKQNLLAGVFSFILWIFGLGWITQFLYGLMGFMAINKGEDFEGIIIGGMAKPK